MSDVFRTSEAPRWNQGEVSRNFSESADNGQNNGLRYKRIPERVNDCSVRLDEGCYGPCARVERSGWRHLNER